MKFKFLIYVVLCFIIACSSGKTKVLNQKHVNQASSSQLTPSKNLNTIKMQQLLSGRATHLQEPSDVSDIYQEMESYEKKYENIKTVENTIIASPLSVQLCLLLDTSNSMDGLINQAKGQLWEIVNELSKSKKNNQDIQFEVALYEYGNTKLPMKDGFIHQVTPFTKSLDKLSEHLFALKTNGGDEFCGHVIASSVNQLAWNPDAESLKLIYIAGNESFAQGEVNFKVSCQVGAQKGILINTIFCGNHEEGIASFWYLGATLGLGQYFSIDSDQATEVIPTPFDDKLLELNEANNATYIYYGTEGEINHRNQMIQDNNARSISKSNFASRSVSKGSKIYSNTNWDLVDASSVEGFSIKNIEKQSLPKELQNKSNEELLRVVQEKKEKRLQIQKEISALSVKRAAFIQNYNEKNLSDKSLGSVIIKSLRTQAKSKNFIFN